jgi:hypothetical protein
MRKTHVAAATVLALVFGAASHSARHDPRCPDITQIADATSSPEGNPVAGVDSATTADPAESSAPAPKGPATQSIGSVSVVNRYYERDLEAMRNYRPGYEFWHHVFSIPDGRIAFGSALDGSLLATFPQRGDWLKDAYLSPGLQPDVLGDQALEGRLSASRDAVAMRLMQAAGPVVEHATRGSFIAEGTGRFGSFLAEWGAIFERFGVPAEVGLAQALVESGLQGTIRSDAGAFGFCQWMPANWDRLQALSPHVIEAYNQTTQAPFCAAHLAVLATKYGSLIPALSEHHAGSMNVSRAIINGDYAGGDDVRDRYFLGAELTLLVRQSHEPGYREVAGSYGPRSYLYAEMVFGNTLTIAEVMAAAPQKQIFAVRPARTVAFDEVASRTGLSADEIRRFNPALINRVPAGANLYLPDYIEELGQDTAFWHRPPSPEYAAALGDFTRLDERFGPEDWHDGSVFDELRAFEARFRATNTEEGTVMATVIGFLIGDLSDRRQQQILAETRISERAQVLREEGVRQRQALLQTFDGGSSSWAYRNTLLTTTGYRVVNASSIGSR